MKKGDYDPLAFGTVDLNKGESGAEATPTATDSAAHSAAEDILFESGSVPAIDTFMTEGPQFVDDASQARPAYDGDDTPAGFDAGADSVDELLGMTAMTPQSAVDESSIAETYAEAQPKEGDVNADSAGPGAFETSTHQMGHLAPRGLSGASEAKEPEPVPSGASLYQSMAADEPEPELTVDEESEAPPPWLQKGRSAPRACPRTQPHSDNQRVDVLQLPRGRGRGRRRQGRGGFAAAGIPLAVFAAGAIGGAWIGLMYQNPIMGGVVFVTGCVGSMFCRILLR